MPWRIRWKGAHLAPLFVLLLPLLAGCTARADCRLPPHSGRPVQIVEVIDGDTVRLASGRHVRFIGVNTPELAHDGRPAQPLAMAATQRLREILAGETPRLLVGQDPSDHYGRLLAHPFLGDGRNVTARLLEAGLGFQVVVPPNVRFADCYREAENRARAAGRGVWAEPAYRPVPASRLTPRDTGFRRVRGTVSRIGESRTAYWLNLGRGFALRLPKKDRHWFDRDPRRFAGRTLTVRGWIYYVKKRHELRMNLRHPLMIERIE